MKTKVCTKCHKRKRITEFHKDKFRKNGHRDWCKICVKKYDKNYRKNNKEKIQKQHKKYNQINKEKIKRQHKNYFQKNKDKINNYRQNKLKKDINFKLASILRTRISMALKYYKKFIKTKKLVRCSLEQLKQHLEKQFKSGMSWKNYGKWHVDHKRPCSSFDLSKLSEQRKCFNYKNLQPLWAKENLRKSNRTTIKENNYV